MEIEAKQIIDIKRNLFKIDVRAQQDEEKVFMRTACPLSNHGGNHFDIR
ncbi:exfoliative toxin [Streptococcus agalactiae]|nr:exfoliative toxin [Streptococcus agalactiae]